METRHAALGALGASPLLVVPRRSWRQRLLWPLLLLVGVVALASSGWGGQQAAALSIEVVGRPIAQKIVDHAEVEIHEVRLAPASWEGLQARAGMLAVDCSIDMSVDVIYTAVRSTLGSADLHIEHDGRHVGVLSTLPLNLGGGGSVRLAMAGTLVVEDEEAFRHLVQAVTYGDRFSLQVAAMTSVVLRGKENGCLLSKGTCATVGTWKIPNVRFAKTVNLLGARGFPVTLQEFRVRDMPGEGGAPPIPGAPIFIELQAQISNPSSFSLSSLDVIDLDIHTDRNEQTGVDGVRFVAVRTPPGFYVARGTSPWWPISGKLEVPPRELDMYSVSSLFARLLKHDASDSRLGLSVEMRGDSRRFYDAAVRGLAIGAALPPLQLQKPAHGSSMPYPFVQAAHIDLDIPKAIFTLTQPFGDHVMKNYIWLDLHNPLDVSVAVVGVVADITTVDGVHVATVSLRSFEKEGLDPIVVAPASASQTGYYPLSLDGSIPSTIGLLTELLNGPVHVTIHTKVFAHVAGISPIIEYEQTNVTVRLH